MNEEDKIKDGIKEEEKGTSGKPLSGDAVKNGSSGEKDVKDNSSSEVSKTENKEEKKEAKDTEDPKEPSKDKVSKISRDMKGKDGDIKPSPDKSGKKEPSSGDKKEEKDDREITKKPAGDKPSKKEKDGDGISFELPKISRKAAILIASAALLLFLGLFVSFSSLFRVKSIEIVGNYAVSDEEIIQMAGIEEGDFIFRFDWISTASRMRSQEPYIRNISFHTVFPSKVRIEVDERAKIAYISMPDGYAAVDEEGIVLEFSGDPGVEVHPVICGIECDHAVLGHKLEIRNTRDYQKMIIVLGAVLAADRNNLGSFDDYSFFDNLQEVRIIPSGMIFLTIRLPNSSTVQVKLNDINTITDQMNWLIRVVGEGKLDDQPNGVLDMTGEENIFRPYE